MAIPNLNSLIKAREKTFGQLYNKEEVVGSEPNITQLLDSLFEYIESSNNKIMKHLENLSEKIDKLGDCKK